MCVAIGDKTHIVGCLCVLLLVIKHTLWVVAIDDRTHIVGCLCFLLLVTEHTLWVVCVCFYSDRLNTHWVVCVCCYWWQIENTHCGLFVFVAIGDRTHIVDCLCLLLLVTEHT